MNAILCDVETKSETLFPRLPGFFSRTGATALRQTRCPFCDSIIYSRRHKLCGVCAEELPVNLRFDSEQAQNVTVLMQEERQRHRAWLQRFGSAN